MEGEDEMGRRKPFPFDDVGVLNCRLPFGSFESLVLVWLEVEP